MMQKVGDAKKLEINKDLFVGKSLKSLLREINPGIKMVFAEGQRDDGAPNYFVFKFVDRIEQRKYNKEGKKPLGILIYVKEKFVWDKSNQTAAKERSGPKKMKGNMRI